MSTPSATENPHDAHESRSRAKIRNRVLTILALLGIIIVLFGFLVNYKGFQNWEQIDTNLTIFVAVNVNIVLLTTVFYMILRNLFKLVYERRKPFSAVSLKTKLIIAFVALSLPSTAFHLMASGFMAFLFENWSQGEYRQLLESSRTVAEELSLRDSQLLRRRAEEILPYLPRFPEGYAKDDWLKGYRPRLEGGLAIYDAEHEVIARWVSGDQVADVWQPPPSQTLAGTEPRYWVERAPGRTLQRLVVDVPNSPAGLKMELYEVSPPALSKAMAALNRSQQNNRVLSREVAPLMLTFLIVMTLLIIFAASWIAFYLARGFVTPIERLDDATHRVSEGELGYEVDGASLGPLESDFRGLVNSFNTMSRQLMEQRMQLLQTAEDLRASHHALGERNRLVELLLENIDAGILSLNPQGNVTAINRAASRLVQPRVESWQNRHYKVVLGREIVGLLDDMLERMRVSSERQLTQNLTLNTLRKGVIVEMTLLSLENSKGASEGTVVLLKDVTSLQRNQRALAWREVARRVAHEIKNPLTPIQLSAQRIRRRYLERVEDGEVLDHCTQTIINEVASLKKMVNEFSQFAKLPESKPMPDDMNTVIEDVARFYRSGLPEGTVLDLHLGRSLPQFPIDREQMKRVFTNLIDNALASFNGEGGTITIRTSYDEPAQAVNVDVMDDGSGVPDHIRSRMFEPYTSTKEGGTGLGLTIVNQIVSDHNGYIRYNDRKPKGTVFTMEFRLR